MKKSIFLLTFLFSITVPFFAQNDWKLDKSEDGIEVYIRTVENTSFKEFKGVTSMNAEVSEIVELIIDFENSKNWSYGVKEVERLKTVSPYEHFVYYIIDMPWPLEDRDIVNHLVVTKNMETGVAVVVFECVRDYMDEKEDLVRMKDARGSYKLTPEENGMTKVEYQYLADPEGIPSWVVNFFMTDAPMETLEKMKEIFTQ